MFYKFCFLINGRRKGGGMHLQGDLEILKAWEFALF